MMDDVTVFRQHMEVWVNNQSTCGKSPAISEEKYNAVRRLILISSSGLKDAGSSSSSAAAAFIFTIALQVQ